MKFTAEIHYAAAPEAAFAMLVDEGFQEQVCRATGALEHEVEVVEGDGGGTIRTVRTLPADGLPDFARSFIGSTLDVVRLDTWQPADPDGSRRGTLVVEIKGAPIRLDGTWRMTADGDGTHQVVSGDLKASIPFLGGKVESAAEPAIRAAIAKEQELGREWLAGH